MNYDRKEKLGDRLMQAAEERCQELSQEQIDQLSIDGEVLISDLPDLS